MPSFRGVGGTPSVRGSVTADSTRSGYSVARRVKLSPTPPMTSAGTTAPLGRAIRPARRVSMTCFLIAVRTVLLKLLVSVPKPNVLGIGLFLWPYLDQEA